MGFDFFRVIIFGFDVFALAGQGATDPVFGGGGAGVVGLSANELAERRVYFFPFAIFLPEFDGFKQRVILAFFIACRFEAGHVGGGGGLVLAGLAGQVADADVSVTAKGEHVAQLWAVWVFLLELFGEADDLRV